MKIRNLTRLGALALTMTMVTTSLMGGTLAKYTTTVSGTDTVTLARFGYEANDGADDVEYTTDGYAQVDLFDDLTTAAEGTIQYDEDGYMYLAPGAYGTFQIELDGSASDVDIEMADSTVEAVVTGAASATEDMFISYTISYGIGDSSDFTPSGKTGMATNATNMYDVHRVDMAQFALDLETVLAAVVLEKNTIGTITVEYAWEEVNSSTVDGSNVYSENAFDFHDANETNDLLYDKADTELGQKWAGDTAVAPTFSLLIDNVASQAMTDASTYTDADSVAANAYANFNVVLTTSEYAWTSTNNSTPSSNYTIDNDGEGTATNDSDTATQYVSFDMNGVAITGEAIADIEIVNDYITLPKAPASATHTFVGWGGYAEAAGNLNAESDYGVTESTTLYAIWDEITVTLTPSSTVPVNITGMPTDTTLTLNSDGTVTLPTLDSDNYTFDGWFTDASNGDEVKSGDAINADTVLYAQWSLRLISDGVE